MIFPLLSLHYILCSTVALHQPRGFPFPRIRRRRCLDGAVEMVPNGKPQPRILAAQLANLGRESVAG